MHSLSPPMAASPAIGDFIDSDVAHLIALGRSYVPSPLIGPASWRRLLAGSPPLPRIAAIGGFECHLDGAGARTDFQLCIRAAAGRAALTAGLATLSARFESDRRWARVLSFCATWGDPTSQLFEGVPVIWFEFDLDSDGDWPAPFVIVTLNPELALMDGEAIGPRTRLVVKEALALLSGGLDPATQYRFDEVMRQLPGGGRLLHVALRPDDRGTQLRVVLTLPWRRLPHFLAAIEWSGDIGAVERSLSATSQGTLMQSVNLDIAATVGSRVGVEYYYPAAPARDARWQALFDHLVTLDVCDTTQRRALEQWSSRERPPCGPVHVERELLVKVVHATDAPLRAKAYLPFGARRSSAPTPRAHTAGL